MPHYVPIVERFWRYVQKTDYCWIWTSSKNNYGYGQLSYQENGKQKTMHSHRLSWEIHNRKIPEKMCVLHKCDNPICCNPDHLFLGTKKENTKDMVRKRRHRGPSGESHPSAKLTTSQVEDIKNRLSGKWGEQRALAKEYRVSDTTISAIKNGIQWKRIQST